MLKAIKFFFFSLFAVVFIGCGSAQIVTTLQLPYQVDSDMVMLTDERPESQKKFQVGSLLISSCSYGILQLGEENENPNRVEVLRNYLAYHMGETLIAEEVKLRNFTIHINDQVSMRGQAAVIALDNLSGSTVPAGDMGSVTFANNLGAGFSKESPKMLPARGRVGCKLDEPKGGYYITEYNGEHSPLVVLVDLEIGGKVYRGRSVRSVESKMRGQDYNSKWNQIVQAAIEEAAASIVSSYNKTKS